MAWVCTLGNIVDLGSFYAANPLLTGRIFSPPPSSGSTATAADTATAAPSPFALTFAATAAVPAGAMALLVEDPTSPTSGGGDFFRWADNPLPASPASIASFTVPTAPTSFPTSQLQSMMNGFLPMPLPLDPALVNGVGIATSGAVILKSIAITSLTVGMAPPNLSFNAIGTVKFTNFGVTDSSVTFTLAATVSLQPSRDTAVLSRVLAVKAVSTDFKVVGLEPNVVSLFQGAIGGMLAQKLEDTLNGVIHNATGPAAASAGFQLTKTAVVSAQRVVIATGGLTLAMVIADLRGPALVPLVGPVTIQVSVAPSPLGRAGKSTQYVVTVTDAKSHAPVAGADVTLTNFSATHNTLTSHATTGASGTCSFLATLREKVIQHSGVDVAPSLTVSSTPQSPVFDSKTLTLDLTP
jgi:hypothetical protein